MNWTCDDLKKCTDCGEWHADDGSACLECMAMGNEPMDTCEHHWYTNSLLRIVVEDDAMALASIIATRPTMFPVDFCRRCGALRLRGEYLDALVTQIRKQEEPT